jgi:hypothetical protein
MYSFVDRSHDAREHDILFQGRGDSATLSCTMAGYDCGAFVDLGATPPESADIGAIVRLGGDLGALVVGEVQPDPSPRPTSEPDWQQALRAGRNHELEASREFGKRRDTLGGSNRASAVVGRTYAVRAVRFGAHDVLAVVHIAARDEMGAVIAWRILKTWPVRESK